MEEGRQEIKDEVVNEDEWEGEEKRQTEWKGMIYIADLESWKEYRQNVS